MIQVEKSMKPDKGVERYTRLFGNTMSDLIKLGQLTDSRVTKCSVIRRACEDYVKRNIHLLYPSDEPLQHGIPSEILADGVVPIHVNRSGKPEQKQGREYQEVGE